MRQEGWTRKTGEAVRRHRPDYLILLYMGLLMLIGLVLIYAVGPQNANVLNNASGTNYSTNYFFIKQLTSLVLALVAFGAMAVIPYEWPLKHGKALLIAGIIACVVLFAASKVHSGIAQCSLGACRWFNLGPLGSLQPAELVKFGFLTYGAAFLGMRMKQGKVNDVKATLVPLGIYLAIAMIFIIGLQKDMGTGIALALLVVAMLFIAGLNRKIMAIMLVLLLIGGVIFIVAAPHRISRILTYFEGVSGSSSGSDSSYQIDNAKIAIGSGGFLGVGVGNSVESTGYLPEAINDSVFAVLGETFGFVGLCVILALFVALLMRILRVMDHLVDIRLKLLAAGVFGWFGAHVILNIAAMTGIFPLTGITLPLLSFGGTSMVFITAALGIVFQLSRYTIHTPHQHKEAGHEDSRSRRGLGRARYPGRSSF